MKPLLPLDLNDYILDLHDELSHAKDQIILKEEEISKLCLTSYRANSKEFLWKLSLIGVIIFFLIFARR